jgi:hypothetical protein
MKSTINGRRYDTEKATLIGEAICDGSRSDPQWWQAGLYKSPRVGRYFLAGEGGSMTRWARGRTYGEAIFAMTEEGAREWAERYLTPAEVEAAFGKQIENIDDQ